MKLIIRHLFNDVSIQEIFTCTVKLTTVSCRHISKSEYFGVLSSISSNKLHKQVQHLTLYSELFWSHYSQLLPSKCYQILRMLLIPQTDHTDMLITWPSLGTASLWRDASLLLIWLISTQNINIKMLIMKTIIEKKG